VAPTDEEKGGQEPLRSMGASGNSPDFRWRNLVLTSSKGFKISLQIHIRTGVSVCVTIFRFEVG
jgi:hypothetical protein